MIQYDANGIITQNITEILDERENALKSVLGEDFTIDSKSPIGNMELADANNELTIQELIAWLIPNQIDANTATGVFLDAICEKNRIYRKQPQFTTLNLIIKGAKDTSFLTGDITISDSVSGLYYNLNEDCVISENGEVIAQFICQDYGEFYPISASKFEILTPINGLDSVVADFDNLNLVIGRLTETDEELRRRRMFSVQQTSTTTLASIKSVIYSLDGVKHVTYFENDTESVNDDGLPMKSFEFVVDGGDEVEITDAIFTNKTVGTRAYGTTIITKYDSENNNYQIGYTKAKDVNIVMDIHITTDYIQSNTWKQKVLQALKDKFDEIQNIGSVVKDYNYYVVLTNFPEITDINSIEFYTTDNELQKYQQYPIGKKEIAKLDISNINLVISQV